MKKIAIITAALTVVLAVPAYSQSVPERTKMYADSGPGKLCSALTIAVSPLTATDWTRLPIAGKAKDAEPRYDPKLPNAASASLVDSPAG